MSTLELNWGIPGLIEMHMEAKGQGKRNLMTLLAKELEIPFGILVISKRRLRGCLMPRIGFLIRPIRRAIPSVKNLKALKALAVAYGGKAP